MKQHIKTVNIIIAQRKHLWEENHERYGEALNEVVKAAERYEFIRTLAPVEFTRLWQNNIHGRGRFDDLVDAMMKERK